MSDVNQLPAPLLTYSDYGESVFNVLRDIAETMWERAKERTAEYIADAGIFAETISHKYRNGKYYRRLLCLNGKKITVSYDLRTKLIAVNGKPIKAREGESGGKKQARLASSANRTN